MRKLRIALLYLLAVGILGTTVYWFVRDVAETIRSGAPDQAPVEQVSEAEGWFPAHREPLFGWEQDTEGWLLESEQPLELTEAAPPYHVASAGGTGPLPSGLESSRPSAEAAEAAPAAPVSSPRAEASAGAEPAASRALRCSDERAREGAHSLEVPVQFPAPATIHRSIASLQGVPSGLRGVRFIAYAVFVPAEVPGYVGCLFFLKDKDGLWYQARSRTRLLPGQWTTVAADLSGGSPDVAPLGHLGQWEDNQASQVRTVGITFYGDRPFGGCLWVDNFRGWMRPEPFLAMLKSLRPEGAPGDPADPHAERWLKAPVERIEELARKKAQAEGWPAVPLAILNLRTDPLPPPGAAGEASSPPTVGRFQPLTVRFELNRLAANPFDPALADVQAKVEEPGGRITQAFGFWYQDFESRPDFAGEALAPVGRPEWRVRFTPRELGEHRLTLEVRLKDEPLLTALPITFVSAPSSERGFVRVSKQDPSFFEFEDGTFFYPVGHNVHTPVDLRCWKEVFRQEPPLFRGLNQYRDFFPKMGAAGENVTEIWMASWWVGLEWTRRWRHYYGAGRYSLEHAWLLDRLVEEARRCGLLVHLVIDNHGKFSQWCDWEWDQNPYRIGESGGLVNKPSEFFTDSRARELHRRRLRYVAARWAADPAILGWELVSEFDLVGDGQPGRNGQVGHPDFGRSYCRSEPARAWVREMVQALRTYDPYAHPITNHYATDFNHVDRALTDSPVLDYITGDAYREEPCFAGMASATAQAYANVRKPFWITEYGGNWNATSIPRLEADLHSGLWASWLTPAAGTPLFWWYDFVDRRNLYPHYRAFAHFIRGEERRGLNGSTQSLGLSAGGEGLAGLQLRWSEGAYAWVYEVQAMSEMPAAQGRPRHEGAVAHVPGLTEGVYRIEFWDTYTGKRIREEQVELAPGAPLELRFPGFENDMAVKVKRTEKR